MRRKQNQIVTNASYTQSFLTSTQHIFLISKNAFYSGNKNLEKKNEKPIPDKKIHNIKIYSRKKKSRTHILEKGVRSFYICIYFFLENFRLFWNGVQ